MRNDAALIPCADYLGRLPLPPAERERLLAQVDAGNPRSPREAMTALHRLLAGGDASAGEPAYASVAARLRMLRTTPEGAQAVDALPPASSDAPNASNKPIAPIAPPICRRSMVPHPWGTLNPLLRWWRGDDGTPTRQASPADPAAQDTVDSPDPRGDWQHNGNVRRLVLLVLMLAQTAMATWFMGRVLPYQGTRPLEMATMALFAILFCWVSAGFWTAMAGFLVLLRGSDRYVISRRGALDTRQGPIDAAAR
ncbi:MAG: glucans biosynthesis glucosyltransferase MdoH, partial [Burkholderiaceae bacterium]